MRKTSLQDLADSPGKTPLPIKVLMGGLELMAEMVALVRRRLEPKRPSNPIIWPDQVFDSPSSPPTLSRHPVFYKEPKVSASDDLDDGSSRTPKPTPSIPKKNIPLEEPIMNASQDLSGSDMIKVVQYCIVSVVPGIADNARVLVGPKVVAFADDMTAEDFTAWIIAENCATGIPKDGSPCYPPEDIEKCWDRKYLRVAFFVMGKFHKAEINWEELQALSVAKIASKLPCNENP